MQSRRINSFKVQVAVRVRPHLAEDNSDSPAISVIGNEITTLAKPPPRTFAFDRCFNEPTPQRDIYRDFGAQIVEHALEGYNACIFAYGQTGSGKSHTMLGSSRDPGLIPQVCERLFTHVQNVQTNTAVTVRISYLEIYNEQVRDLLSPPHQDRPSLRVRGTGGDDCYVEGLSEFKVTSVAEVLEFLKRGTRSRATASTKMNDTSSRSHAVVSLTIKQQSVAGSLSEKSTEEKLSVLRLVDLAGSERAGSTNATGDRLREGANINKSLVTLGRVISALAGETPTSVTVVPYRESILTRLLENSLGGNSRTAMIACVSPDRSNFDQTLSTLRYADQAKRITTRAHINRDTISDAKQAERLAAIQHELTELRQQLLAQRGSAQYESEQLSKLVQFYEDEAARERVRGKMLEQQAQNEREQSLKLADYLREISGRGLSSIDVPQGLDFDALLDEQAKLTTEISQGHSRVTESLRKWRSQVVE